MLQQQQNQVSERKIELQQSGLFQEAYGGYYFVSSVPQMIEPEPMNCILPPSKELGGLYLGGLDAASNVELLRKYNIRAVLTTSIETPLKYSPEIVDFHECMEAHDKDFYDITTNFEQAINFIDKSRNLTSVLVHCYAGVSRSASCLIAYLMKIYQWPLEKCLWYIRQKRRFVRPNPGFMKKLIEYEKRVIGIDSIKQAIQTNITNQQNQQLSQNQTKQLLQQNQDQQMPIIQKQQQQFLQQSQIQQKQFLQQQKQLTYNQQQQNQTFKQQFVQQQNQKGNIQTFGSLQQTF